MSLGNYTVSSICSPVVMGWWIGGAFEAYHCDVMCEAVTVGGCISRCLDAHSGDVCDEKAEDKGRNLSKGVSA